MKATGLMIGDWVNYSILNLNAKVFSTLGNHTIGIQFVDNNNKVEAIHGLLEETINPIPLTEEILVKNGWRKQIMPYKDEWYGGISLFEEHGKFYYMDFKIEYVHQLQQLLRLMGIEKEIKL